MGREGAAERLTGRDCERDREKEGNKERKDERKQINVVLICPCVNEECSSSPERDGS